MDSSGRWWTTTELDGYINDWSQIMNNEYGFVLGFNTVVTATTTLTASSALPGHSFPAHCWANGTYIPHQKIQDLDSLDREWRTNTGSGLAKAWTDIDAGETLIIYPVSTATQIYVFEYPICPTLLTDSSTLVLPAWTKYSVIPYGCWKAYLRQGPNHSPTKALRYKAIWDRKNRRLSSIQKNYWPRKTQSLKMPTRFEGQMLNPTRWGFTRF